MLLHSQFLQDSSNYRLDNNPTPVTDTQDPYPWLELDDTRCFPNR